MGDSSAPPFPVGDEAGPSTSNPIAEEEYPFYSSCGGGCGDDELVADSDVTPKGPYVGDREPLSSLEAEFQNGNPILQEKIKLLGKQYAALRRTRGDGNCFYRAFMFAYLEHILETQDKDEVNRILSKIEHSKKTLQTLGYADFTFEDFFLIFVEQLQSVLHGYETSISHEELVERSRDQSVSDYVVMFFRFVTSGEIQRRAEFYEPFIAGLSNTTVVKFCKSSVEPMGEESDHVHIIALTDTLGVPIRVVYLDRSSSDASGNIAVNHHDFIPAQLDSEDAANTSNPGGSDEPNPLFTLLYRPGHYDILYPH